MTQTEFVIKIQEDIEPEALIKREIYMSII